VFTPQALSAVAILVVRNVVLYPSNLDAYGARFNMPYYRLVEFATVSLKHLGALRPVPLKVVVVVGL